MSGQKTSLIVGGTSGLGFAVAEALAARGEAVVVSGRDLKRAEAAAAKIGHGAKGLAFDLAEPASIGPALAGLASVDHLVIAALERDLNSVKSYDVARAQRLATIKLVGYVETVHALAGRFAPGASVVLFGGQARVRPYPGSVTVTSVNGAVTSLVLTLAAELPEVRVNALHPGLVGDSPFWLANPKGLERARAISPGGRLPTTADCVTATLFLLDVQSINGENLVVDSGAGLA